MSGVLLSPETLDTLTAGRRALLGLGLESVTIGEEMLQPGDALLLSTDGFLEARDEGGTFFGLDRLSDFLQRAGACTSTMRRARSTAGR